MRCLCPKCKSNIELDLNDIPGEGAFNNCPECSAGFLVSKVSFARRALHKGDEITCAECGSNPGTSIFCQHCHAIYPDFHIAESSSAAKKQFSKILGFMNKRDSISARTPGSTVFTDYGSAARQKNKIHPLDKPVKLVATLAIVLILAIAGGYYWYQERIENKYTESYVRALYGIKAATDLDLKTCKRISADWQKSMVPNPPQPTGTELTYMTRANKDVETLLNSIGEAPEKFKANSEDISELSAVYKKLHAFATNPTGSIDSFTSTTALLDDEFRKSSASLKARLPEKISTKLADSKKKYKALEDF